MSITELCVAVDIHGILERLSTISRQAYYKINNSPADKTTALQRHLAEDLGVWLREQGFTIID